MKTSFTNYALITGASSGIGAEAARLLAEKGHSLILTARREDRLKALKTEVEKKHGVKAVVIALDLSRDGAARELYDRVSKMGLVVDVLVNNAGFGMKGEFAEADPTRIEDMLRLNVVALTSLTRHFAGDMKSRKRGRILQVASVGAFQPSPYFAAYAASKAYVLSFGEALSFELKPHGVTVTTVYPGVTLTEFFDVSEFHPNKIIKGTGMSPRDVAKIALDATFQGRVAVIPGLTNKVNSFFINNMPRCWATSIVGKMMKAM